MQDGFDLIVGGMREGDDAHTVAFGRGLEDVVPSITSGLFDANAASSGLFGDVGGRDFAGNFELPADLADPNRVLIGFGL